MLRLSYNFVQADIVIFGRKINITRVITACEYK